MGNETKTPIEVVLGMTEDGFVSARKLYEFLELAPAVYARWCKRNILENVVAVEGEDYYTSESRMVEGLQPSVENPLGGRPTTDYLLTIDFAKSLCMICNTEKGRQAREYFKGCEKALVVTKKEYDMLRGRVEQLGAFFENKCKEIDEVKNLAISTAAKIESKEGGSTFADSHEAHWIHTTYEQVKRLAEKRGMSVSDCLTMLVNEMDESRQLDYTYAELARDYRTHHPDQRAERLAVLAQDLDSQMAFEYILEGQMDYWGVLNEDERKVRSIFREEEYHVDTENPGFLALWD